MSKIKPNPFLEQGLRILESMADGQEKRDFAQYLGKQFMLISMPVMTYTPECKDALFLAVMARVMHGRPESILINQNGEGLANAPAGTWEFLVWLQKPTEEQRKALIPSLHSLGIIIDAY
jgi:hypothetical protein